MYVQKQSLGGGKGFITNYLTNTDRKLLEDNVIVK